jgi:hypothetical protein
VGSWSWVCVLRRLRLREFESLGFCFFFLISLIRRLSLCMVRLGLGRFGVGFWVGLRAWDFPTERVLPQTPFLIIRTVDQITKITKNKKENQNPYSSS